MVITDRIWTVAFDCARCVDAGRSTVPLAVAGRRLQFKNDVEVLVRSRAPKVGTMTRIRDLTGTGLLSQELASRTYIAINGLLVVDERSSSLGRGWRLIDEDRRDVLDCRCGHQVRTTREYLIRRAQQIFEGTQLAANHITI